MLRNTLQRLVVEEEIMNEAIMRNIRCFLSSTKGRDKTLELHTKQAILTAYTYSSSGNSVVLDKVRDVLGARKT